MGTGVEFHSQFIQVCLSAIKTRQHALIFYTRRDSQKAITHKFLIMFCLLASVTTRSNRRRNFRREKSCSRISVQTYGQIWETGRSFCHGHLDWRFNITHHERKTPNLVQDNCPKPKWVDILRAVMITKSRILTGELAISKLVFPGHGGSSRVRRLVESYYFFPSL